MLSGYLNVQIAAYLTGILFNEGNMALLKIFEGLGVQCGANIHAYVTHEDVDRLVYAEQQAYTRTKESFADRTKQRFWRRFFMKRILLMAQEWMIQYKYSRSTSGHSRRPPEETVVWEHYPEQPTTPF